ncbi:MAG: hypothetical protein R3Y47_00330 [Lachnospiraceae bacterium]
MVAEQREHYEEHRYYDEIVIDLQKIVTQMFAQFKKTWIWGLIIGIICVIAGYTYAILNYQPLYRTSASFLVKGSFVEQQNLSDSGSAYQMGATFSYVLRSTVLRELVALEVGIEEVEADVWIKNIENTNIITITVQDKTPELTYVILEAYLSNYPSVSEYVLGTITLDIISEGGIPTEPENGENKKFYVLLGTILGGGIYAMYLFLHAYRSGIISSKDDIENIGERILTTIPMDFIKGKAELTPLSKESIASLGNMLEKETLFHENQKIYLVTSSNKQEGKSVIAVQLAKQLVEKKHKVLYLNSDLNKDFDIHSVHSANQNEWKEQYIRDEEFQNKIFLSRSSDGLYSLTLVDKKMTRDEAITFLLSRRYKKLLLYLKENFDYMIVDTPAMGEMVDTAIIASIADAALFVVRDEFSEINKVKETITRLKESDIKLLGLVVNSKYKKRKATGYGYDYSYGYGYGKQYGSGYGKQYGYGEQND